ncbi:MAG: ribonuclease P protein component [Thermoanaerobaculales bacterium]|nr:ribonuclease P protein component [Thermoanaerobaculales bacterium]
MYARGLRISGRYLVLFMLAVGDDEGRFGVTASRRVGGAVLRARCRRRLRELYRLHRESGGAGRYDIVANARRGLPSAPWDELERDFLRCLGRRTGAAREAGGPGASRP